MLTIVLLTFCVASAVAEPFYGSYEPTFYRHYGIAPLLTPAPVPIALDTKTQYHFQDGFGSGTYGHSEPTAYHHATHDSLGNKQGEFSYLKPDGTIHKTHYIADSEGYRVLSNDLPVGPSVHSLHKRSIAYQYGSTPIVTPSGHLADTPEVSAAKAAHFLEHAKRGNYHIASSVAPTQYSAWSAPVASWSSGVGSSSWPVGRSAHPTVTSSGYLQETPEVAQATAAHLAEKLKVEKYWDEGIGGDYLYKPTPSQYYPAYTVPHSATARAYSGYTPIAPEGPVTDTPEVTAARNAHLAEHSAALARSTGTVGLGNHVHQFYTPTTYLQPSGVPADTPEVMHAKAAHFAEFARVASRQKRSIPVGVYPASTLPLPHPVLAPVVLPHSTLALPYSLHSSHLSNVIHSPFASSYQIVA